MEIEEEKYKQSSRDQPREITKYSIIEKHFTNQ